MYHYQATVNLIREWITSGALKAGDKVPSVREMSERLGHSTVTVHHAYSILEDEGTLEARPRSGFYVSASARPLPQFSAFEHVSASRPDPGQRDSANAFAPTWGGGYRGSLGSIHISDDLLPHDELYRHLTAALRDERRFKLDDEPKGNRNLRELISRRMAARTIRADVENIVVTRGMTESFDTIFEVYTQRGDTVILETPTNIDIIASVENRDLKIVEIYSHPRYGVDPEQLSHLLDSNNVAACILSPHSHKPTGVSYSTQAASEIVETASARNIPIIENCSGLELIFGERDATTLKHFDRANIVTQVGGFGDTLGSRFGLGWVVLPDQSRYFRSRRHLSQATMAAESATQAAVAEYVGRRGYERHLRKLRDRLADRMRRGLSLISQHLPDNCAVSRPQGGYLCWIRGPKGFDALLAAHSQVKRGIDLMPGPLFSVTGAFPNFFALNCSHPWTSGQEQQLEAIARTLNQDGPIRLD